MYRKLRRCLLYFRRDRCLFTLDRDVLFKIIYIPYVHVDIKISYVHIYIYIYVLLKFTMRRLKVHGTSISKLASD